MITARQSKHAAHLKALWRDTRGPVLRYHFRSQRNHAARTSFGGLWADTIHHPSACYKVAVLRHCSRVITEAVADLGLSAYRCDCPPMRQIVTAAVGSTRGCRNPPGIGNEIRTESRRECSYYSRYKMNYRRLPTAISAPGARRRARE